MPTFTMVLIACHSSFKYKRYRTAIPLGETMKDLRRRDPLTILLFNIVWRKQFGNQRYSLQKIKPVLAYADDLDVLGRNVYSVKEHFTKLERIASVLEINEKKTNCLVTSSANDRPLNQKKDSDTSE